MDRNSQRQNRRTKTTAPSCTAGFTLNTPKLPVGRATENCALPGPGPSALGFQSLTACPPPPAEPRLIPLPLLVSSDATTAYCPTAGASYALTGATAYSLSAGAQQQGVFFQALNDINNNQLNYLYDIVPSASGDIISYSLSGNTAAVQDIVKLTLAQTEQLMSEVVSAKFIVNTIAVQEARNGLVCQTFNDAQFVSCPTAAYFGSSAAVPNSLKPYAVTAYTATGTFISTLNLVSSTGDQEAFRLANIASLTAAKAEANSLASAFVERQLICVYANDLQQATCHTGPGSSVNNLNYTNAVPNDTLAVLPDLTPRIGSFSVTADTVFSNISKTAANEAAVNIALSSLVCYFPNEDTTVECGSTTVASPYPILSSFDRYSWSGTADTITILSNNISVNDLFFNTRVLFSASDLPIPTGITSNTIYYAATAYSVSGGVSFKLNSVTGTHAQYESGYTGALVNITTSTASLTASRINIFTDYTTGRYSYALRGRILLNDLSSSVTAANVIAQSNLNSLLECYWSNGTASATCAPQSFTAVDGNWYTLPASPTTSPVYNYTLDANSIISFVSQEDANQQAQEQAENNLQCYYCNMRVDPLCTPDGASAYSDNQLPIDPNDFIPNCWSINATSGMPPNEICDIFAPGAQNTAITISSIPLRDKKITEDICCYESEEVINTIFCEPEAIRGVSGLNSQDSFFLPSGTIVLCTTGGVPPRPEYRFAYNNLWIASSFDYFCCTGSTCYSGDLYEVGTLYGDATLAFSTNPDYTVFYTTSSPSGPTFNFGSSGAHGFTAYYLIQAIPGLEPVAREVVVLGGIPSSGTRNIDFCGVCDAPKTEYSFDIASFTLPYSAKKVNDKISELLCGNLNSTNTSVNIFSYSSTALNNLANTEWYAAACGNSAYAPVTSTTGYILADISATGYAKYMVFNTLGQNVPYTTGTAAYLGASAYTVSGLAVTTTVARAVSDIFCNSGLASSFVIYSDRANAFSPSVTGTRSWYSSTCGIPFTPNSGTSYVLGFTSVTGDKYYTVFSTSGANTTTTATSHTAGCFGVFAYDVIPATVSCSAPTDPITLYGSITGAFTTNAAATAYFYTAQYSSTALYNPPASITAQAYLNFFTSNGIIRYRSLTGSEQPWTPAIDCGQALYPVTVYYSNTSAAEVCSYPWAVGVTGLSGYNNNVITLYSDNPYPFDLNSTTKFFTAANTGTAYIFNNGPSGSTTYLAPYNNITDFNDRYRVYVNGPSGATAVSASLLSYTGPNLASKFNSVAPTGDAAWQQTWEFSPCSSTSTLKIVNPATTSSCETRALYTDIPEVFISRGLYRDTTTYKKYYPGYTTTYTLFNDGVDVPLGTGSAPNATTIILSDMRKIGAVFPGAVLQTLPTNRIDTGAYVSDVDLDTGTITLAGGNVNFAAFSTTGSIKIIGLNIDVPLYSTTTTLFNLTSSADLGRSKWTVGGSANTTLSLAATEGKLVSSTASELYSYLNGTSVKVGDTVTIRESATASATAYIISSVSAQSITVASSTAIVSSDFRTPLNAYSRTGTVNNNFIPLDSTAGIQLDMPLLSAYGSETGLSWWNPSTKHYDVTWQGGAVSQFIIKNTSLTDLNGLAINDKVIISNFDGPVVKSLSTRSVSGATMYVGDTAGLYPNMYISLAPTGAFCRRVVSLTYDGYLDQTLVRSASASANVHAISVDPTTSRIFIGGEFASFGPVSASGTYYGATSYQRLVGLSPTGEMQGNFDGGIQNGIVYTIKPIVAPTGYTSYNKMLLVGGTFTSIQQQNSPTAYTRSGIARYEPLELSGNSWNYILDPTFAPTLNGGGYIQSIDYDFDNSRIYIGGGFNTVNGVARTNVAALGLDGTLISAFNPVLTANVYVSSVIRQSVNSILIGGGFTSVNGNTSLKYLTRVNSSGVADTSFAPNISSDVFAVGVQSNNQLVIGGGFTSVGGTSRSFIARLNNDGTLDTPFNLNVNGQVLKLHIDRNDNITFAGAFTSVNNVPRAGLARVNANGVLDQTFNPKPFSTNAVNAIAYTQAGTAWIGGSFTQMGATTAGFFPGTTAARIKSIGGTTISLYPGTTAFGDTGSYFIFSAPTGPTPGGITMGNTYYVYSLNSSGADTVVQLKSSPTASDFITLTNNDTAPFTHKKFESVLPGIIYSPNLDISLVTNLPISFSGTGNSNFYKNFPVGITAGTTCYVSNFAFGSQFQGYPNTPFGEGFYINVKATTAVNQSYDFINFNNSFVTSGATALNANLESIIPANTFVISNSPLTQVNNSVFIPSGATVSFGKVLNNLKVAYPENKIYSTSPLINKLKPGSMLSNGGAGFASVTKVDGNYIDVEPITSQFMANQTSRVINLGRQYIQFWNDNNKQSAVTGYYQDSATAYNSYVFKDQTQLILRGKSIKGISGSTAFLSSFYISSSTCAAYPGGISAASNFPIPYFGSYDILSCSGGSFYQYYEYLTGCDGNAIPNSTGFVGPLSFLSSTAYMLGQCETGSGTAYRTIQSARTGNTLYVYTNTCTSATGMSHLVTSDGACFMVDTTQLQTPPNVTTGHVYYLGERTATGTFIYEYPCAYPCNAVAGFAYEEGLPADIPSFDPTEFGDFSPFNFESEFVAVGSSAACHPKQTEANIIAQDLVNSFVRCYYLNEFVSYTNCPNPGDILLNPGIVKPGTFVSTVSQADADRIADNMAESLRSCVPPDEVGANATQQFDYTATKEVTLKQIKICASDGTTEPVYVMKIADEDLNGGPGGLGGDVKIQLAFFTENEYDGSKQVALKPNP